ncbi:4Fe-4S binding protein [Selenomonas ruminantium]|uniref:4Fe-4S binding protein n=1 Tax=Selenomonas ruminantium TaxID=971 RepID=UPI0015684C8F|nr:4Fe-4S binding protein [Selenomonas ruminantium]
MKKHWYHYLWIWSLIYFGMGFFNILFAWMGLISFALPLIMAIGFGNKRFCNRYCDRGQTLRALGQLGFSRRRDMPAWMKSKAFRYGFMLFFFGMFGSVLYTTWLVYSGAESLQQVVSLLWTFHFPWEWAYSGAVSPWTAQFAFGLYSLMLTSEVIALITMLLFRPRSWCVYCPMGTLTQLICQAKAGKTQ